MSGHLLTEPPAVAITVILVCLFMAAIILTFCCRRIRNGERSATLPRVNEAKYTLLKNHYVSLHTKEDKIQPPSESRIKVKLIPNIYRNEKKNNTIKYNELEEEKNEKKTDNIKATSPEIIKNTFVKRPLKKESPLGQLVRKRYPSDRQRRPDSIFDAGLGRITFTLRYSNNDDFLTVHLISGRNLYSQDMSYEFRLPVVSIQIEGQAETEVVSNPDEAPNPEYDQEFTFMLKSHELYDTQLKFTVWDIVSNHETRVIGFFRVNLTHFYAELLANGETGAICKDIRATLCETTERLGEILVSLCYDCVTDKIKVTIVQIKDLELKKDDQEIYIKLSFLLDNNVIHSKRSTSLKAHQSLYVNTTFEFNALSNDLDQISSDSSSPQQRVTHELLANAKPSSLTFTYDMDTGTNTQQWSSSSSSMVASDTLRNNMGILVSVRATTGNSNKRVVGRLYLGKTHSPSKDEDVHWHEMIKNFDSTITQWHYLKLESF